MILVCRRPGLRGLSGFREQQRHQGTVIETIPASPGNIRTGRNVYFPLVCNRVPNKPLYRAKHRVGGTVGDRDWETLIHTQIVLFVSCLKSKPSVWYLPYYNYFMIIKIITIIICVTMIIIGETRSDSIGHVDLQTEIDWVKGF